jgi:hypothetical protein
MKLVQILLALTAGMTCAIGTHAALSVTPAGYTNDFSTLASVTNNPATGWWTKSGDGGDNNSISNLAQLDASVQTNSAPLINTGLGASSTTPPSANAVARWNATLQNLQTRPTGNMYTLLMAELQNHTGTNCNTLVVGYDLGVVDPGSVVEEIPGQRLYYSLTGAANSWQPIGTYGNAGRVAVSVELVDTWSQGASLYLLWADDNGSGQDYAYQIDNLSISAFEAPPGASVVTWDVDPTNSYVRLTIPDQSINVTDIGNVTLRMRDASSTSQWTDAGGRRAALDGQIVTDYMEGSWISFRGGSHNLYALEATALRPNPTAWGTTNYTDTSTALAALGGRVRGTYILTFDAAFVAFRSVKLDITNATGGVLVITNGAFATNTTRCGISTALVDVDGLELPLSLGQPIPDVLHASMDPMVEQNVGGGSITNLGGLNRKLTYTINIPQLTMDLSGTIVTGSVAGLVVAYAVLPPPPTLSAWRLGTNLVLTWPTNLTGFSLLYATNLPATSWFHAAPPPVIINDQNVVTNAMTRSAVFYRLRKP